MVIKSITAKEIKKNVRDKGNYFWLFVLPIVFIVLFSSIFSSTESIKINYIDNDKTPFSKQFIKNLSSVNGFEIVEAPNDFKKDLERGKLTSVIELPKGFESAIQQGKTGTINFHFDGASDSKSTIAPIESVLENILNEYQNSKFVGVFQGVLEPEEIEYLMEAPVTVQKMPVESNKVNAVTQFVPGYAVMFTFFIIITMSTAFVKDRRSGMFARLSSTPMKGYQYLVGMWVPYFLMALIQLVVLFGFGYFVYDLQLGNFAAVAAISIALCLTSTGLGLGISLLAKNEQLGIAITQILAMGGAVLGGLWFPLELLPEGIQKISQFVPQYWAQKAFLDVMARGAGLEDVLINIGVLLGYALIGFVIARVAYKGFLKGAIH